MGSGRRSPATRVGAAAGFGDFMLTSLRFYSIDMQFHSSFRAMLSTQMKCQASEKRDHRV
jgi:hypothetical protein